MIAGRMPHEHVFTSARVRADDPNLPDDPNVRDANVRGPATRGIRPPKSNEQLALAMPKAATQDRKDQSAAKPRDIVIDVLVAYTQKAASNYSDIKRDLVDLAIEEANQSFRLSNVGHIKLRLVHAYQIDYVEEDGHFDHVWRLADKGDGYMEEIHSLRDIYGADVAVLVVNDARGCGLATRVQADADEAFAVVHHECAANLHARARDRTSHRRKPRSRLRQRDQVA